MFLQARLQFLAMIFHFIGQIYTHDHLGIEGLHGPDLPAFSSRFPDFVLFHDYSSPRSPLFVFK